MAQIPANLSALYLSHGGGPLPLLGDAGHQEMRSALSRIAAAINKPAAIVVISAHWEAPVVTLTASPRPAMIYDYAGFPKEAYSVQYPAPGAPQLAERIQADLAALGVAALLDAQRGYDHGLYVPLLLMYPEADIPCMQLSLHASLKAREHIHIGAALAGLQHDNVLIIGSGFSFHNMREFSRAPTAESRAMNEAFEAWLIDTCCSTDLNEAERADRLGNWQRAPHARFCHPREEHLLPLHVCYGASNRACRASVELTIMQRKASFFCW